MRRWMMMAGAAVTLALATVTVPALAQPPGVPIVDDSGNLVVPPDAAQPNLTPTYRPAPGTSRTPVVYKPQYLKWRPCPAGTVDAGDLALTPYPGTRLVDVSGWVEPCQNPTSSTNYAVFGYSPGGDVDLVKHFTFNDNVATRTSYRSLAVLDVTVGAVCLVTHVDTRVACLAVAGTATDADPLRFSPLSTDDPLVDVTLDRSDTLIPEEVAASTDPCPACPRAEP